MIVKVNITYVTVGNSPAGSTRQNRHSATGSSVTFPYNQITLQPNTEVPVSQISLYTPAGAMFAYISGIPQPAVIPVAAWANASTTVNVGTTTTIDITFFCGGSGGGNFNGVSIDAFDAGSGQYINNFFVAVAPDASGTVTNNANVFGTVSSTTAKQTITADLDLTSVVEDTTAGNNVNVAGTLQFTSWLVLYGNDVTVATTSPLNLVLQALTAPPVNYAYALALYKTYTPPPGGGPGPNPICIPLLARIQDLEKILTQEIQSWENLGSLPAQNPMNGPLASTIAQLRKEYLASGCLFPVTGGPKPPVLHV